MAQDDDFQQRLAALLQAEREGLARLRVLPVVEVTGICSAMGGGSLADPDGDSAALRLALTPWRLEGGPVCHLPVLVRRVAPVAEIDALLARCGERSAVRLHGHLHSRGSGGLAVLLLREFVDVPVQDAEFDAAIAQAMAAEAEAAARAAPPVDLDDPRWGRLAWDASRDAWVGRTRWSRRLVDLQVDAGRGGDAAAARDAAAALFDARATWQATIDSVLGGELRALYNDTWRQDGEPPLDTRAFARRLRLHRIEVGAQGQVAFWLHDGGLFGEHDIQLAGQLDRPGLQHALVG